MQDQRGRHPPAKKTDANVLKHVNDHIESFPHYTSHYSRKDNPNKLYLSPDLSLSKMYSLYKTHCEEQGYNIASEWVYRREFNEKHNLSFGS